MGIGKLARGGLVGAILRWAGRLRFPYLFVLTVLAFVINVFVPDALPFADEIIIGLVSVLLGSLRRKTSPDDPSSQTGDGPRARP